jgi:hypothetical protein
LNDLRAFLGLGIFFNFTAKADVSDEPVTHSDKKKTVLIGYSKHNLHYHPHTTTQKQQQQQQQQETKNNSLPL